MRFNLDVPVEKRSLKARDAIRLDLEFPPGTEAREALADWRARSASVLASLKPGRVPGPVKLTLTYEERAGRRDLDHLIRPVVDLCVHHALIDSDHRATLREVRAGWGAGVRGLRLTIEPATQSGEIYSL
jgi:Holliday junction resolvase RusA-like endonuclease